MSEPLPFTADLSVRPEVVHFFDEPTNTFSYIVRDPASSACAVIDCVMDLDYAAGRTAFRSADRIADYIQQRDWKNCWIIETHAHADHLSAAFYLREKIGGKIGIGSEITTVQSTFAGIFNEGPDFKCDGSQFDRLFTDGDSYRIGNMIAWALHTPGHTPACMSHVIGDATFVGDTLFMPDQGTARADFPGGNASTLFRSIRRLLSLPGEMRLYMCHDYPDDRPPECLTTVADERADNIHVREGIEEAAFVAMRQQRDKTLDMPRLILPSLQVNIRGGHLPEPASNGKVYLKVPVNVL